MKLLLIEDHKILADTLTAVFTKAGYLVDSCDNGEDGVNYGLSGIYDVIILDWMLPKKDGVYVLKELRKEGITVPILMLTAKEQLDDKIMALDTGADDYLTKPFETKELLARVRALARRRETFSEHMLSYGKLNLNTKNMLMSVESQSISLSVKEGNLMEMLLLAKGNGVSKESIILKIWGYDSNAEDNYAEVYISFLRRKLQNIDSPIIISTLRGLGYCLKKKTL